MEELKNSIEKYKIGHEEYKDYYNSLDTILKRINKNL